jgi:hypothetical protein
MGDDAKQTRDAFAEAVNMTASELEKWLDTEHSRQVGDKSGGSESTGHRSGRRIVELLRTKAGDLTDDDLAHMRKVVGYVHRHLEQRPDKPAAELAETPWRYSLMNWGHDPLK